MTADPRGAPKPRHEILAAELSTFIVGDWLPSADTKQKRFLIPLLVGAYQCARDRSLTKTEAYKRMGATPNSGPDYLELAQQKGFIEIVPDEKDARKEVILPTKRLQEALEEVLEKVARAALASGRMYANAGALTEPGLEAVTVIDRFVRQRKGRNSLVELPRLLPLAAHFDLTDPRGNWYSKDIGTGELATHPSNTLERARPIFLRGRDRIKVFPGHVHHAFLQTKEKAHPDDLGAAAALVALCDKNRSAEGLADGFREATDFTGTLFVLGDAISNAVTRLVLEYQLIEETVVPGEALERVEDPLVTLDFVPMCAGEHMTVPGRTPDRDRRSYPIYDTRTNESLWASFSGGRQTRDYLLITVLPNFLVRPYPSKQRILIFSGIHGVGTRAIDLLFTDAATLEQVEKRFGQQLAPGQVLIEVSSIRYDGDMPRAVRLGQIRRGEVKINEPLLKRFLPR